MNESLIGKKRFSLSREQKINWIRLIRSENVGPVTFRDLVSHFGTAAAALDAIPDLAKRGGAAARIRVCSQKDAEREFARCEAIGGHFVAMGEPEYPSRLREIDPCPPILAVRGSIETFQRRSVSIVGSRNASINGVKLTQSIARNLGLSGYVVVSGLARGIDAAAHRSSLDYGTIAVFAGGIDQVFPEENEKLAQEILAAGGSFISEMPVNWRPRARDFPRRNRIVAGLSYGVLIVEAAQRSGSLITARLANEIGRLVMALPGSPLDPRSAGTNNLIKQGASLVTNADDILALLAPLDERGFERNTLFEGSEKEKQEQTRSTGGNPLTETTIAMREKITASIGHTPTEVDDIIRYTNASPGEVHLVLLELDLAGRLERHGGNLVSLLT